MLILLVYINTIYSIYSTVYNYTTYLGTCYVTCYIWQWHRNGSSWSPVRTPPVAPLWCDLGFVPNSLGNKAAAILRPIYAALICYVTEVVCNINCMLYDICANAQMSRELSHYQRHYSVLPPIIDLMH